VRSTADPVLGGLLRHWDVLLPFIVYFGQRRGFLEGLVLSILTSHLYSLSSTAPIGLFVTYYLTVFGLARLVSYVVYADQWYSVLLLMLGVAGLSRFCLVLLAYGFGHQIPVMFFRGMLMNSMLGLFIYWLLSQVDKLTYKVPRMNIELSKNSL